MTLTKLYNGPFLWKFPAEISDLFSAFEVIAVYRIVVVRILHVLDVLFLPKIQGEFEEVHLWRLNFTEIALIWEAEISLLIAEADGVKCHVEDFCLVVYGL